MRIMGLDVGSKTVGVAISDPLGFTAQGVEIVRIDEEAGEFGFERLEELVKQYKVDDQGNETLFEILLTIDGREEFGKNYVLLVPAGAEEDEQGQIEIQAYSFTENEDGTEGDLQPIPEDSDAEWDMIEEVFNSFLDED